MPGPVFEIYKDHALKYRFRLKASNGEIIATGEAYETKQACKGGIESVIKNAPIATVKELQTQTIAKYSFFIDAKDQGDSKKVCCIWLGSCYLQLREPIVLRSLCVIGQVQISHAGIYAIVAQDVLDGEQVAAVLDHHIDENKNDCYGETEYVTPVLVALEFRYRKGLKWVLSGKETLTESLCLDQTHGATAI